jgi:predicted  nucleic acid-binding Zn-ribbon protein
MCLRARSPSSEGKTAAVTLVTHMDVDAPSLHQLLAVQNEDTAIKRLQERRSSLPEAQKLSEVNETLAELTADLEIATKQHDEVAREQDKLEGEIGLADQKIGKEEQRLFSGAVSNPKELGALQAEVAMLKRKKAELEDQLLEVMVQKEDATATLDRLRGEQAASSSTAGNLTTRVAQLVDEIDSELSAREAARTAVAEPLSKELLDLYEKIRATKNGVGVAALEAGTCQGCHTKLANKEVERIRSEGGLQRCENCRRILVFD